MKVPQGRPTIAHRFNGGSASAHRLKSRRDGRRFPSGGRVFFRPSGAYAPSSALPTVETAGYFLSPLRGCTPPEKQKPVERLVCRILAAQQKNPAADTSTLEREMDQPVHALGGLSRERTSLPLMHRKPYSPPVDELNHS